ncbi:MAG: hypothetical protein ABEI77_01150 [Halorientalis sp.]
MFGIETLSGSAHAAAIVGLVLVEAIFLYIGYGAVERLLGSRLMGVLRGRCALAEALTGHCSDSDLPS